MNPFSWETKRVISWLSWATFSKEALPETLTDEPGDNDAAVDCSEDGEARDTSVESFYVRATNWDALLDTAGVPTDGTPPDPLESSRLAEQMGIPSLDEMSKAGKPGTPSTPATPSTPSTPGITSPKQHLAPPPPGAQDKANRKGRAGRGVEGEEVDGPTNDFESSDPFDWDVLPLPGLPGVPY